MQFLNAQYLKLVNAMETGEEGQGLVEYALIIALVAIVLVAALNLLTGGISSTFGRITTSLGS